MFSLPVLITFLRKIERFSEGGEKPLKVPHLKMTVLEGSLGRLSI